jgi:hypothetical protein
MVEYVKENSHRTGNECRMVYTIRATIFYMKDELISYWKPPWYVSIPGGVGGQQLCRFLPD